MIKFIRIFSFSLLVFLLSAEVSQASPPSTGKGYFELKVYHFANSYQEASIDSFLQYQYIPALHKSGISNIGVFKALANDTAADKKLYVFIPYQSLKQWEKVSVKGGSVSPDGGYVNAVFNHPAYTRMETLFLKAFPLMPAVAASKLTGPKSERVYELRSYESASEKIYKNKVQMFNEGGEIELFARLGFNAIFYSEVLFGSRMPNLMYMTSFDNMKSRDEHWKAFGADPFWKILSAKPEYQHNVQRNEITFLKPAEYSDL